MSETRTMSTQKQLCDFKKSDSDSSVRSTAELEGAGRMLLKELDDDGEEEIFFGPMTDREKLKSKKMRRKTKVFKPGFRVDFDKEEEEEPGREGIGEEPAGESQGAQESADKEAIEVKDIKEEKLGDCGSNISDMSPSSVSSQSTCSSSGNTEIKEGDLEEDSNPGTGLSTWHTPSPTQKRLRSSESAINVNTPPFSLVTVSPQADAAVVSEDYGSCGVELFNATDSVTDCDSTCVETGIHVDGSTRVENKTMCSSQSEGTVVRSHDETVAVDQVHCADISSKGDLGEVGMMVETDVISSSANVKMDAAPKHLQISNAQSRALPSRETVTPAVAKPTPSKRTAIYSTPLLISTTVQRVQMQQPICYGNNSSLLPVPVASVVRMDNLETGTDVAHQTDPTCSSTEERNVAPSVFCPTGHTAFGKPTRKVDDLAASQIKGLTHSQTLLPTPSAVYQSPSSNVRHFNQGTNSHPGLCILQPCMLHKENVNPDRQPNAAIVASDSAVKYHVLSSVSSPIVSALCSKQPSHYPSLDAQQAPSPRVLQLSNRQASAGSPSAVARQRLIDEKRALLARLRAEKQELRQRIKEDNEKCFNMKLENAAALQSNMARGMTPVFDRLPSRGCNGRAALTLTERELEVVTKLHTIRNSQHTASDRTQSPCHQAICHRDQSRLHWREDLILNIEELSSPSRPRCKARTILSKKGHNSVRRGAGLQPSSSSSPHSGQPRAKQHLLF